MLTPAHIASSYLLSQIPRLFGQPLHTTEIGVIALVGNIVDLDFLFGYLGNKRGDDHHNFVTHTPLLSLVVWVISFLLFSKAFSSGVWILILVSALLHFVLDDIGYWFCRLGLQEASKYPQVNWLYPFKSFSSRNYRGTNRSLLKEYLYKARVNVLVEGVLVFLAIVVFLIAK